MSADTSLVDMDQDKLQEMQALCKQVLLFLDQRIPSPGALSQSECTQPAHPSPDPQSPSDPARPSSPPFGSAPQTSGRCRPDAAGLADAAATLHTAAPGQRAGDEPAPETAEGGLELLLSLMAPPPPPPPPHGGGVHGRWPPPPSPEGRRRDGAEYQVEGERRGSCRRERENDSE